MSLSATLFYTTKVFPKEIITNKSSIPDDPKERVKDKIFMSVVFTVKHICEYKEFIVPETRLKEDVKVTAAQLKKIFESLSKKYNVEFKQQEFKTVGELTIYVKDHKK